MHLRQYLFTVSDKKLNFIPRNFSFSFFDNLHMYFHNSLTITKYESREKSLLIAGIILDPLNPNMDQEEITKSIYENANSLETIYQYICAMTGRFILRARFGEKIFILTDPLGLRQVFYGEYDSCKIITSSPKLFLDVFNLEPVISNQKRRIINSENYIKKEQAFFGCDSLDDRLKKVLPNHYLIEDTFETRRLPLQLYFNKKESLIIEESITLLKGTFKALSNRFSIIQQLTAGVDSRILLAASTNIHKSIKYYTFGESPNELSTDCDIAQQLANKCDLDFRIIYPDELHQDFLDIYNNSNLFPRILRKTKHIQYHYYQNYDNQTININGNGGEVARFFYGRTQHRVTPEMLTIISGYSKEEIYIKNQIYKWFDSAHSFSKNSGIPLGDLFYWEQRMGNWGSLFPFELDLALEEISPFNNRRLLLNMLEIPEKKRTYPSQTFFKKLIQNMWPEMLSFPFNPNSSRIKNMLKQSLMIRYFIQKYLI